MTGNDVEYTYGTSGNETGCFPFWTEDCYGCEHRLCLSNVVSNRMHAAVDEKHSSYYVYDHSGERRVKLTGTNDLLDVNADYMYTASVLKEPTIYPSAYMVMSNRGYTKHYYAGAERVAARIGGGGLKVIDQEHGLSDKSGSVFKQSLEQINERILEKNDIECIANGLSSNDKLKIDMNEVPERLQAKLITDYSEFRQMIADAQSIHHNEPDVYFYHSDHLGSASWITDNGGLAVQHLQYLPYGERYVDQRASGYHERFTFTGKERDEETGYGYFGARYMDHELMTMWLSVDPMADKYPNISPYAYCAWNPVKLVDPDGREIDISALEKKNKKGEYVHKQLRDAFIAFANTETGKRELAKYAKEGQHFYGIYFSKNGEYHNEGINIKFSDYSQPGYSGVTIPKKKGENLSIEIKTSNFTDISACLENIGHEFFIHANQAIKDYRDNGFLDHSFLPEKLTNEVKNSKNSQNYAYTKAEHKYFAYNDVTSRKDLVKMMQESKMYKNKTEIINLINGGLGNNIKMNTNGL